VLLPHTGHGNKAAAMERTAIAAQPPAVVVCGDFNGDANAADATVTAVETMLRDGVVCKGFVSPSGETMCRKKARSHPFGAFADAYAVANDDGADGGDANSGATPPPPPVTFAVPNYERFLIADEVDDKSVDDGVDGDGNDIDSGHVKMAPALRASLRRAFDAFADTGTSGGDDDDDGCGDCRGGTGDSKVMSRAAVIRWLTQINCRTDRGAEMRHALKLVDASKGGGGHGGVNGANGLSEPVATVADPVATVDNGDVNVAGGTDTDNATGTAVDSLGEDESATESLGGTLSFADFTAVYQQTLDEGKPWSVAYDLWLLHCEEGCLPPLAAGTDAVRAALAPLFTARFDRIMFTPASLALRCVREPRTPAQVAAAEPLPNAWSASDHLPIAAVFKLL
jgi:hypothetical protein